MLLRFPVLATLAVAALVLAPTAAAQAPPANTMRLVIANLPAGPLSYDPGSNNTLGPFQVKLLGEQIVCPPATNVVVTVTADGAPAGVTVGTATVTFALQGPYTNATKLDMSRDVSLTLNVTDDAAAADNVSLSVTAAAGAAACQPPTTPSPGSATTAIGVAAADDDGDDDNETDGGSDGNETGNGTKKKKDGGLPGLGAPVVLVTLALAALVAGRRRRHP